VIDWYRDGEDVAARLPRLSTYLGHREPRNTYRYLSASPELLGDRRRPPRDRGGVMSLLAPTLQSFLSELAGYPERR
jgi:hypothetical protein